jgi:hypothetical protein
LVPFVDIDGLFMKQHRSAEPIGFPYDAVLRIGYIDNDKVFIGGGPKADGVGGKLLAHPIPSVLHVAK